MFVIYRIISPPRRYCVLLITGDDEIFSFGNQAFLSFASTNSRDVVRFAYVYQRLQQPLCDILTQNKDSVQPQPQVTSQIFYSKVACCQSVPVFQYHLFFPPLCAGGYPGAT